SPRTKRLPIVAISGSEDAGVMAVTAGADAFVHKPFDPLQLVAVLERVAGVAPAEGAATAEAGELRRLIAIAQRQHELLVDAYRQTLEALVDALASRDFGTGAHSRRVSAYATRLTIEVAPWLVDDPTLEWGFLLHDVGKIGIPDRVLLKPSSLTETERRCVEQHTLIGERLVGHVPLLAGRGIGVIRSHHERITPMPRSEEHTSELQSHLNLVCRLLLEKKKNYPQHPMMFMWHYVLRKTDTGGPASDTTTGRRRIESAPGSSWPAGGARPRSFGIDLATT